MNAEEQRQLRELLGAGRWAAIATARDNEPLASWVAVAAEDDLSGFLLHLSHLALHTRYLEVNPRVSLSWSAPDGLDQPDPQQLARVSLQGRVAAIARGSDDYAVARALYLRRLPQAAPQFELGDFELYRFVPETGRYVPGFGRVHRIGPDDLRALVRA
ncbi:MAG: CREG family protein [Desulfosudis oleivorans]|nr:CREG family protein [Desulfosudis oleivorans]